MELLTEGRGTPEHHERMLAWWREQLERSRARGPSPGCEDLHAEVVDLCEQKIAEHEAALRADREERVGR